MLGYLDVGDKVKTTAGTVTIVGQPLDGGEGAGYKATLDGNTVFYKQFRNFDYPPAGFANNDDLMKHIHKRVEWLVDARLDRLGPFFNAPFAMSTDSKRPGYVCSWIDGLVPWSDWRGKDHRYGERVCFVGNLGSMLHTLHSRGISHGDINAKNVCIMGSNEALQVILIDFGNSFNGDPSLRPVMSNDCEHISPWLDAGKGMADTHSDLYAFGVMTYEALLGRNIDAGGLDENDMNARRARGTLPGDPLCGTRLDADGRGLPFTSLSPSLQTALRGLLSPDPGLQPTAQTFMTTLADELQNNHLMICPKCKSPFWWHTGLTVSPCCKATRVPPALQVQLPGGRVIPLHNNLSLGRNELPGNPYLSTRHLVVQPAHPGVARVYVTGRNGMTLITGGKRFHVTPEATGGVLVKPNDHLEFQDIRIDFLAA
ncbi:MAG: protein kinase [Azoarcus sp.]|jgi:hypothetical protein|nr:protein kinase [Azoarcus sp.]